jgi:hypothetical protein
LATTTTTTTTITTRHHHHPPPAQDEVGEKGVAVLVIYEEGEEGGQVHFEAFQCSQLCVRLWREGWIHAREGEPSGVSRMVNPAEPDNKTPVMIVSARRRLCRSAAVWCWGARGAPAGVPLPVRWCVAVVPCGPPCCPLRATAASPPPDRPPPPALPARSHRH